MIRALFHSVMIEIVTITPTVIFGWGTLVPKEGFLG